MKIFIILGLAFSGSTIADQKFDDYCMDISRQISIAYIVSSASASLEDYKTAGEFEKQRYNLLEKQKACDMSRMTTLMGVDKYPEHAEAFKLATQISMIKLSSPLNTIPKNMAKDIMDAYHMNNN